jgi:hypothetical protein
MNIIGYGNMDKIAFKDFLTEIGKTNKYTQSNYTSWISRVEKHINRELLLIDINNEVGINNIIDQARSSGKYSRKDLIADTKTALRYYARPLTSRDTLEIVEEILAISTPLTNFEATSKKREIETRLGQSMFRQRTIEVWNGRCALTGFDN